MKTNFVPQSWINVSKFLEFKVMESENSVPRGTRGYFEGSSIPNISITEYIYRIYNYAKCSESCITMALIYIDRLIQCNYNIELTRKNVHR